MIVGLGQVAIKCLLIQLLPFGVMTNTNKATHTIQPGCPSFSIGHYLAKDKKKVFFFILKKYVR